MVVESMTAISWILSQWYAQRNNSVMHLVGGTSAPSAINEGHYTMKQNVCMYLCMYVYIVVSRKSAQPLLLARLLT